MSNNNATPVQRLTRPQSIFSVLTQARFPFARVHGLCEAVNPRGVDPNRAVADSGALERGGFYFVFKFGSRSRARLYFTAKDTKTMHIDDEGEEAGYDYTTLVVAEIRLDEAGVAHVAFVNPKLDVVPGCRDTLDKLIALGFLDAADARPWNQLNTIDLSRVGLPLMPSVELGADYVRSKDLLAKLSAETDALTRMVATARDSLKQEYPDAMLLIEQAGLDCARAIFPNLVQDGERWKYATQARAGTGPDRVIVHQDVVRYRCDVSTVGVYSYKTERDAFDRAYPMWRTKQGRAYRYDPKVVRQLCELRNDKRAQLAKLEQSVLFMEGCAIMRTPVPTEFRIPLGGGRAADVRVTFEKKSERRYVDRDWATAHKIPYEEMPSKVAIMKEFARELVGAEA